MTAELQNVYHAYKNGQKYIAANYWQISLTCFCCKKIEHRVTSNITKHAEVNNILYPQQHGFKSKHHAKHKTFNISITS